MKIRPIAKKLAVTRREISRAVCCSQNPRDDYHHNQLDL